MLLKACTATEEFHVLKRNKTARSEDAALYCQDVHALRECAVAGPAARGPLIIFLFINVKWHNAVSTTKVNRIPPNCAAVTVRTG